MCVLIGNDMETFRRDISEFTFVVGHTIAVTLLYTSVLGKAAVMVTMQAVHVAPDLALSMQILRLQTSLLKDRDVAIWCCKA
ncbi:hypothetical protein TNCV_2651941 [Trichonephila clavipes]|nr:hypothetical protein TNCV_2651941 [Trichonephila clavipes]